MLSCEKTISKKCKQEPEADCTISQDVVRIKGSRHE